MQVKIVIIMLFLVDLTSSVYADQIFVTLSSSANQIIFDGKWSFYTEWKGASENVIHFDDGSQMAIKTAHDYDNLYVLIDFISDSSFQKFSDKGIICIDGKTDQSINADEDDYCFIALLGLQRPVTLKGGSSLAQTGFFNKIENHPDLIAAGGISDENDRYTTTPHTSYEFRIPLSMFGKSDVYGFYVLAYDANTGKIYSWPKDTALEKNPHIPAPLYWGELVSPDKSIPEFEVPLFLLLSILFMVIFTNNKLFTRSLRCS